LRDTTTFVRFGNGLPSVEVPAAHDHGVAERGAHEMAHLIGQPPRQRLVAADDPIARHRPDQ